MTGAASPSRVALVIGSGGVKCAAALGLQQALLEAGIEVDMVVGCSGGSLYAAVTALGFTLEEAKAATLKLWTREVTAQRNRRALLQLLFPRAFGFSEQWGFRKDELILERLRAAFGDATFADGRIPLHLTATDFRTGEQVVLSRGACRPSARASRCRSSSRLTTWTAASWWTASSRTRCRSTSRCARARA